MKKAIRCLIVLALVLSTNIGPVNAAGREKGNPTADYSHDGIILADGSKVHCNEYATLFFLNGTLITDYEIIIQNGRTLVPVRLMAQELGASVDWNGDDRLVTIAKPQREIVLGINSKVAFVNGKEIDLDCPAIIHKNLAYVPLRFVAENLEATVTYSAQWTTPEFTYYYDTQMPISPVDTIIRDFANIIVDEKYDFSSSPSAEEARRTTQGICLDGLKHFSENMRGNLVKANEDPNRFDADFQNIKKEIERMIYIGEVSRFYKYTIGPYDILFDRISHKAYFVIYSSSTIVKEIDIDDPGLYMPVFIVG